MCLFIYVAAVKVCLNQGKMIVAYSVRMAVLNARLNRNKGKLI